MSDNPTDFTRHGSVDPGPIDWSDRTPVDPGWQPCRGIANLEEFDQLQAAATEAASTLVRSLRCLVGSRGALAAAVELVLKADQVHTNAQCSAGADAR